MSKRNSRQPPPTSALRPKKVDPLLAPAPKKRATVAPGSRKHPTTGMSDLKAELMRNEAEVLEQRAALQQKLRTLDTDLPPRSTTAATAGVRLGKLDTAKFPAKPPNNKPKSGSRAPPPAPAPETVVLDDSNGRTYAQVHAALVAKQARYDAMMRTGGLDNTANDDDNDIDANDPYSAAARAHAFRAAMAQTRAADIAPLVDFTAKRAAELEAKDARKRARRARGEMSSSSESSSSNDEDEDGDDPPPAKRLRSTLAVPISALAVTDGGDDLVEVTDEFGRTRQVPRSVAAELAADRHDDDDPHDQEDYDDASTSSAPRLPPPDHYDATREVRAHGSAFYQLSQSVSERERQLADLRRLHAETRAARREHAAASGHASIDVTQTEAEGGFGHGFGTVDDDTSEGEGDNREDVGAVASHGDLNPEFVRQVRSLMRKRIAVLGAEQARRTQWTIRVPASVYDDLFANIPADKKDDSK